MAMACMKMALLLHLLIYASLLMADPINFLSPSPSPSQFPSLVPSSSPSPYPAASPRGLPAPAPAPSSSPGVKGGYWLSWRSWNFTAADINTAFFTLVYYAFVSIDAGTYHLLITQPDDQMLPNFTATLHSKSPPAKALLSVGGATASTSTFSQMVSSKANRAAFINSTVAAARKYNLDGFDLDWEYPSNQEDMDNLGVLFEEWRAAAAKEELLITAAVYFSSRLFLWGENQTYPGESIRKNVDWVNIMSFDYKGSWNTTATGAPAALYDPDSNVDTSYGIDSWLAIGVPPEKVVMGLPLYGRTWQLRDAGDHGIGAPAVGAGLGNGVLMYMEVSAFNKESKAHVVYDNSTVSTYSYAGTEWIGYDEGKSVGKKIEFAKQCNLGGYFFWALGYDDKDWTVSKQVDDKVKGIGTSYSISRGSDSVDVVSMHSSK